MQGAEGTMPPKDAEAPFGLLHYENLYSPSKHGRTVNNTNQIKTKQLQSGQKHLKLNSNLQTRLAHNALGRAKPKYS